MTYAVKPECMSSTYKSGNLSYMPSLVLPLISTSGCIFRPRSESLGCIHNVTSHYQHFIGLVVTGKGVLCTCVHLLRLLGVTKATNNCSIVMLCYRTYLLRQVWGLRRARSSPQDNWEKITKSCISGLGSMHRIIFKRQRGGVGLSHLCFFKSPILIANSNQDFYSGPESP